MKLIIRAAGSALGLLLSVAAATAQAPKMQTGLGGTAVFAQSLNGDFVVAGASTRVFQGPQANGFDLQVAGIPNGSTIVKAFADWSYLTDDVNAAANKTIEIDGTNYNGNLVGQGSPDLGWKRKFGASYLADVTDAIKLTGGNGTYTLGGITDNGTPSYGEGVSFLVVYSDPTMAKKQIDVYAGYTSTSSGDGKADLRFFKSTDPAQGLVSYGGGATHFFTNALDGQGASPTSPFTNDWYINKRIASGSLGTGPARQAWRGNLGPGAAGTNLYDHAEGDSSGFMRRGNNHLLYQTIGFDNGKDDNYSDLVGHSFAAISYQAIPEGSTLATFSLLAAAGLISSAWRLRGKVRTGERCKSKGASV